MSLARACTALVGLSFRRLWWSTNTLILLFPLLGCGLFVGGMVNARGAYQNSRGFVDFTEDVALLLFTTFLAPVVAVAYGTSSLGGDREDRTLIFLLMRPVPRWLVLFSKYLATVPLVLGLTLGSFYLYAWLAGPIGLKAFDLYWRPMVYLSLAYNSLFHLFSVWFRHSTIVGLTYSMFVEGVLGLMPGVVKRLTLNFYARSMIIDLGNLDVPSDALFAPVPPSTAVATLWAVSVGGLLLAMFFFSRREYRDLT